MTARDPHSRGAHKGPADMYLCTYKYVLRAFSSAWAPRGALSLRFPVFGGLGRSELTFSNVSGPPTLSLDACAAKRAPPV